ncbi:MAG: pilus assembly protein N-terminal domain-containing protein [Bacteroides sp.]|nr:pilus assembly protein N-terminal domain-containing protein [Bacteroides sp.]
MRRLFIIFLLMLLAPVYAYQDYIVTTNGKLTDISIEDNKVIDVYPLVTIMNDKNTLIVHPLKVGSTRFCVLKNNKNIVMFNIKVEQDKTQIDEVEGFDILPIDTPDGVNDNETFELDIPPMELNGRTN